MNIDNNYIKYINQVRDENGFKTIDELIDIGKNNTIFDIFSVLIGKSVLLGTRNVIYPNVLLNGKISIGNHNILFNGINMQANKEVIDIGSYNEIGENIAYIKAIEKSVIIKNECRIMDNCHILDGCYLGNGSQVLGSIKISNCFLCDGKSYKEKNPNSRGGVIKGFGIGNNLRVGTGMVINGNGKMTMEMIERQEVYHGNWKNEEPK